MTFLQAYVLFGIPALGSIACLIYLFWPRMRDRFSAPQVPRPRSKSEDGSTPSKLPRFVVNN